ncbi:DNA-binding winged helix-turn-helix (wHTH) protein [Klebsiella oxytoca]|uniref:DNA-binding winged helix-turn-helix (WHTH) protein n=1 Tax=Klebsiella oxytoca TaxID=571 RepID=A0A318FL04_KLEOX|nr:winged helix-turn-helix domain-containing protein [Klebsiella oxytoca]PXW43987.1 DNA-binding winged helix-turn-helix (wHTH) protein [Klebsiella oxytoca]
MNYIFEDTIRFDAKERSLTHIETHDIVSLAWSGCVLLEYLIQNQGATISRNCLLDDIFKKNELVDSDSNLSQNISMLRKGFRDLGVDKDILVTKPRVGLLLPEEVKVAPVSRKPPLVAASGSSTKNRITPMLLLWPLLLVLLLPGLSYLQPRLFSMLPAASAVNIDGCKVNILNNRDDAPQRIAALIQKESLQCDDRDTFYYLDNDPINVIFETLVHCRTSVGSKDECSNYLSRSAL